MKANTVLSWALKMNKNKLLQMAEGHQNKAKNLNIYEPVPCTTQSSFKFTFHMDAREENKWEGQRWDAKKNKN